MDKWNPDQYSRFKDERSRPFWDLATKVDFSRVTSMVDLGCGTGELTAELHRRERVPRTLGLDSSAAMLEKASLYKVEGLTFIKADIASFSPSEKFDVLFSNAALQWIDEHTALFPRLLEWLSANGQLAVQMPCNFDHPSHLLAEEVGARFGLQGRRSPVQAPEFYGDHLWRQGLRDLDITVRVYLHPMSSGREVVEWTKGTLLTHYEKQLPTADFQKFLADYSQKLVSVIGDGPYLYPFKRLFLYGKKV